MTKPKQVQKKTLRKNWENFFRNYALFYMQGGGHNYGNYCTLNIGWSEVKIAEKLKVVIVEIQREL